MARPVVQKRKRRKVFRSNSDFAAMLRRMIRAHGRRVAFGDETDLAELIELASAVDEAVAEAVHHLHYTQKFSWATIAQATGTTRQNAQQRWGHKR